jgi:hypothetical protein
MQVIICLIADDAFAAHSAAHALAIPQLLAETEKHQQPGGSGPQYTRRTCLICALALATASGEPRTVTFFASGNSVPSCKSSKAAASDAQQLAGNAVAKRTCGTHRCCNLE